MQVKRTALALVPLLSLGLLGLAWWLTPEMVEERFAPDGTITDSTRAQIALLRIGLCVLAVLTPILVALGWRLKDPFLRDYRISARRCRPRASGPSPSALRLMGGLPWRGLTIGLWCALPIWYALVRATFHWRLQWPRCFAGELGIMDNTGVALYLVAVISAVTVVRPRRGEGTTGGLHRWWVMLLGLFCLFVVLEETNWGQIYFAFETPELLKRVNYQGDFSLHNLRMPGAMPLTPTYWANTLSQWLAIAMAVGPALLWVSAGLRRFVWRWEISVPPLLAQAYCAAGALMPPEAMMFNNTEEPVRIMLPSEMREFSIVVAFAIWLLAERNRHRLYTASSPSELEASETTRVGDAA